MLANIPQFMRETAVPAVEGLILLPREGQQPTAVKAMTVVMVIIVALTLTEEAEGLVQQEITVVLAVLAVLVGLMMMDGWTETLSVLTAATLLEEAEEVEENQVTVVTAVAEMADGLALTQGKMERKTPVAEEEEEESRTAAITQRQRAAQVDRVN
jgi:flagellar biosynthesis protein FliP